MSGGLLGTGDNAWGTGHLATSPDERWRGAPPSRRAVSHTLSRCRTWTATRRRVRACLLEPVTGGATPFWLAALYSANPADAVSSQHGADPLFRAPFRLRGGQRVRTPARVTTVLMAAAEWMAGRRGFQPARGEREALTLEAVRLAVELGRECEEATRAAHRA